MVPGSASNKINSKEMLTVLDRPVIEWAVIEAANSGIEEMIFVISSKNSIIEHFDRSEILENIQKNKMIRLNLLNQNQLGLFLL